MRYFSIAGAVFIALSVSASASDYMGWYLGAGIGYGYPEPIPVSGRGDCIHSKGKIFAHAGKLYCAHKAVNGEKGSVARGDESTGGHTGAKLIYGQKVGFMWQGMASVPDRGFHDTCAKQSGKVLQHNDGKWYCDQPEAIASSPETPPGRKK